MRDVAGKTALITGGASGIGLGIAQAFAAAGMRLVIADIDTDAAERARAALAQDGAQVIAVGLDVTQAQSWTAAVETATTTFGGVDVLCNNAGVSQGRLPNGDPIGLVDISEALWRFIYDTNVLGVLLGVKAVAPQMIAHGGGHIVNTASMAGFIAPPGLSGYASSKYAVVGMSEALRGEMEPHGVGVSILCPGGVKSNLQTTTAARRATLAGLSSDKEKALSAVRVAPGLQVMDALSVGKRVLKGVRDDDLYIFSHPEYLTLIEERFEAVRSAMGESAEPGYRDTDALLARSRSPVYTRAIKDQGGSPQ